MISGIFSIGKENPERKIIGIITRKAEVIIACCCVFEIVETNKPSPSVESINTNDDRNKKGTLPFTSIPNQNLITDRTRITATNPII